MDESCKKRCRNPQQILQKLYEKKIYSLGLSPDSGKVIKLVKCVILPFFLCYILIVPSSITVVNDRPIQSATNRSPATNRQQGCIKQRVGWPIAIVNFLYTTNRINGVWLLHSDKLWRVGFSEESDARSRQLLF